MRNQRIWVLIADAAEARICSTADGSSYPIRPIADFLDDTADGRMNTSSRAWFGPNPQCFQAVGGAAHFAAHLAQILRESARHHAYDGLVIIADRDISGALRHALTPETCALLIGEIIREPSTTGLHEAQPLLELPN